MHRSGTTLVTKSLERAGIFMGVVKDHNFEAMHFLSLNQQSLWAAKANWLEPVVPKPEHYKLLPTRKLYEEHFKLIGRWQKLQYQLFPKDWGWKDPRNTFTLPMWLDVFPKAKVLHVLRNKQEVAQSLMNRNQQEGEVYDPRLNNMEFNLKLTEQYQNQGKSYARLLADRYHELHYEDVVNLNHHAIRGVEKFTKHDLRAAFRYYLKD